MHVYVCTVVHCSSASHPSSNRLVVCADSTQHNGSLCFYGHRHTRFNVFLLTITAPNGNTGGHRLYFYETPATVASYAP